MSIYRNIEVLHSVAIGFVAGISTVSILVSEDLKDSCILQKAANARKDI